MRLTVTPLSIPAANLSFIQQVVVSPVLVSVGGCLCHAHPEKEQFLSMVPHFLFLYACRFSKFRIVFVCICLNSSECCANLFIGTFKGLMTSYCQLSLSFASYVRLFFLHLPVSLPQPFVLFMPRHPSLSRGSRVSPVEPDDKLSLLTTRRKELLKCTLTHPQLHTHTPVHTNRRSIFSLSHTH